MISFRLNENELALLKIKAGEGESLSLVAKRLLLEGLGVAKGDKAIPPNLVQSAISESIKEGDIGAALDRQYQILVGYLNDLSAKVDNLTTGVDNNVDTPVDIPVDIPVDMTVDICKQDVDNSGLSTEFDLVKDLGLSEIIANAGNSNFKIYLEWVREKNILENIKKYSLEIQTRLQIRLHLKDDLVDVNAILEAMGYTIIRKTNPVPKSLFNKVRGEIRSTNHYLIKKPLEANKS
jgi:hypothetical protein